MNPISNTELSASSSLDSDMPTRLWDFLDPVEYLRRYFLQRKKANPKFSYAVWADEIGVKSRSFLRLVMVGKRSLTEDLGQQIVRSLKFNQTEAKYFLHLISLSRATTIENKEYHSQALSKIRQKMALRNKDFVEIQKMDLFDFLSSYRIPRLQVLLTLKGFEKTPAQMAALLEMKESDVNALLQTLQRLGLAAQDPDGQWQPQQSQLAASDALGHIALQSFHKKSLEEALSAIDWPANTRRYQSLVVAFSEKQLQDFHADLRVALEGLYEKYSTDHGETKKVYQINLNLIPVSRPIIRDPDREPMERTDSSEKEE